MTRPSKQVHACVISIGNYVIPSRQCSRGNRTSRAVNENVYISSCLHQVLKSHHGENTLRNTTLESVIQQFSALHPRILKHLKFTPLLLHPRVTKEKKDKEKGSRTVSHATRIPDGSLGASESSSARKAELRVTSAGDGSQASPPGRPNALPTLVAAAYENETRVELASCKSHAISGAHVARQVWESLDRR